MQLTEQSFGSKRFHKAFLSRESLLWDIEEASVCGRGVGVWVCGARIISGYCDWILDDIYFQISSHY